MEIWNRITYRSRTVALLILIFIFGLLIYFIAIKQTLILNRQVQDIKIKIETARLAPALMNELKLELETLENTFMYVETETEFNKELLSLIGLKSADLNLRLMDFKQPNVVRDDKLMISTYNINVEGNFKDIVHLIYDLENELKMGQIASVRFGLWKDLRTKKQHLSANIYFQTFKKVSDEKIHVNN